jgi:hypothetical protein
MSYAAFTVGYMELNEELKAKEYFNRLSNHFNGPFLVKDRVFFFVLIRQFD